MSAEIPLTLPDILEAMADAVPDRIAVHTPEHRYSYRELDERTSRLANHLLDLGLEPGAQVAVHAGNRIEWVDALYGCLKARTVPVNINPAYRRDDLTHLYAATDCVAAIVAPEHVDSLDALALTGLKHRIVLGEEYDAATAAASPERPKVERTSGDWHVLFTTGTTGVPKGVVWRQQDLVWAALNTVRRNAPIPSVPALAAQAAAREAPLVLLPGGPLLHGQSQWVFARALLAGGTAVLSTDAAFSATGFLDLASASGATAITLLGDTMAREVASALIAEPDRWDLTALAGVSSTGSALSEAALGLLREAFPDKVVVDSYGTLETGVTGSRADDGSASAPGTARFFVGREVQVFSEASTAVGTGEEGLLARTGPAPLGYLKDPARTADAFRVVDGRRWAFTGDIARREADGTVTILGRAAVRVRSGDATVHPEAVAATLRAQDGVLDAAVFGMPHPRWGQQVAALVRLADGASVTAGDLRAAARQALDVNHEPKLVLVVDEVPRTPSGSVDYRAAAGLAADRLSAGVKRGDAPSEV